MLFLYRTSDRNKGKKGYTTPLYSILLMLLSTNTKTAKRTNRKVTPMNDKRLKSLVEKTLPNFVFLTLIVQTAPKAL